MKEYRFDITPSSPTVLAISIQECGEPMVDVRESPELRIGPVPECLDTEPDYTRVRLGVLHRLMLAARLLPSGLYLRIYEGYRSLHVQHMLFSQEMERVRKRMPDASPEITFWETTRLVSPAFNLDGTPNIPPHATGGAVDVEIVDANGDVLDFGMQIREWASVDPLLCRTYADELTSQARFNRDLLLRVMEKAGFVNYPEDWWHFSHGDRYWAYLSGADFAVYGYWADES